MASLSSDTDSAGRPAGEALVDGRVRERDAEPVKTLAATLRLLAAARDRDTFIEQVLSALVNRMGTPSGSFWLYDAVSKTSDLLAMAGCGPDSARESLPRDALSNIESPLPLDTFLVYENFAPRARHVSPPEPLICEGAPTLIRIPLFAENEFLGSFILHSAQARRYTPDETEIITALSRQVVPILRLTRQAVHDQLAAGREERYRLACEIHDALAQHFAGILLQIGVARRLVKQQPEEAWHLVEQAALLARRAVEEARRSVWSLQPAERDYSDLAATLSDTVAQMTAVTSVQGAVYLYGSPRLLPYDVSLNVLRIAQEALKNALHHAQAQHLFVELSFDEAQVRLSIQDDGQGFDLENQGDGGGFGLIGMRQRVERIGGRLTIRSQPGQGTEVGVTVPTDGPLESE